MLTTISLSMSEVTMNLDYLKKNKTSLAVAVMAVYISYTALSQYWVHLSLAYGAFQNLRNMPQGGDSIEKNLA